MSGICAFFGHRNTPITFELEKKLEEAVYSLINRGYDEFWCCNEGTFDTLSRIVMLRVKQNVPYINLCYVSAYNPDKFSKLRQQELQEKFEIIYLPEFEGTYPKFAITRRNKYIAQNADTIICYIENQTGGAFQATNIAKNKDKELINIATYLN